MRELWGLYFVAVLLYFLDCLRLVPNNAVSFVQRKASRWFPASPFMTVHNSAKKVLLLQPLPPLGSALILPAPAANDSFNTTELNRKFKSLKHRILPLRILCNLLFLYLFLAVPWVLFVSGGQAWLRAAIMLLLLLVFVGVEFFTLRRSRPKPKPPLNAFFFVLLSPLNAIRACDYFWKDFALGYHPLAIAKVLCTPDVFHRYAGQYLRNLLYPIEASSADGEPLRVTTFLKKHVHLDDLLVPSLKGSAKAYCPRCWAEYALTGGMCTDCPGVTLKNQTGAFSAQVTD